MRPLPLSAWVGLGSALGGSARWLLGLALPDAATGWPLATLLVNVIGSWLIGLIAALAAPDGRLLLPPALRQFAMAGFCGGFTTFSLFGLENVEALHRHGVAAVPWLLLSVLLWLLAAWLGHALGRRLNQARATRRPR